jgi:alkanesulfonate monooxygenase SsuD/methylene tetrahydromethanopterin reductase-like flavin-dependent oxidoreductase (luciferase family)
MNQFIDEGAAEAGRDPAAIRRILNIAGEFSRVSQGLFKGPPEQWAEQVAEISLHYQITGFLLAADDEVKIEIFAKEVAPAARALVAAELG